MITILGMNNYRFRHVYVMVAELTIKEKYISVNFEYFVKLSWGCVLLIKTSILARRIKNMTTSQSGVLVVPK